MLLRKALRALSADSSRPVPVLRLLEADDLWEFHPLRPKLVDACYMVKIDREEDTAVFRQSPFWRSIDREEVAAQFSWHSTERRVMDVKLADLGTVAIVRHRFRLQLVPSGTRLPFYREVSYLRDESLEGLVPARIIQRATNHVRKAAKEQTLVVHRRAPAPGPARDLQPFHTYTLEMSPPQSGASRAWRDLYGTLEEFDMWRLPPEQRAALQGVVVAALRAALPAVEEGQTLSVLGRSDGFALTPPSAPHNVLLNAARGLSAAEEQCIAAVSYMLSQPGVRVRLPSGLLSLTWQPGQRVPHWMGGWIVTESSGLEVNSSCKIWMPSCGAYWEGSFWNNLPHGYGTLQAWDQQARPLFCYSGMWELGRRHGRGREITYATDGSVLTLFDGEWVHGAPSRPQVLAVPPPAVSPSPSAPAFFTSSAEWFVMPPLPETQSLPYPLHAAVSVTQYPAADVVYPP